MKSKVQDARLTVRQAVRSRRGVVKLNITTGNKKFMKEQYL